jgi:hypothetical protein
MDVAAMLVNGAVAVASVVDKKDTGGVRRTCYTPDEHVENLNCDCCILAFS